MRSATLAVLILTCAFPVSAADLIRVTASCPAADAQTLADTVLSPLFREMNDLDGLTRIESEARNDGSGTLSIYFEPKVDLDLAEVRVHNRVNLALPTLPPACQQRGISVRKVSAGPPQFWLALTSTDVNHDANFLNLYTIVNVRPDCARVHGVTAARAVTGGDFSVQVLLNPDRLADFELTSHDVISSLQRQNLPIGAGGVINGRQSHDIATASGQLRNPQAFESVILRASETGEPVRVKDVARVEFEAKQQGFARVDGQPAALIAVTTRPGQVTTKQLLNDDSLGSLPEGMSLTCLADRSVDRLVCIEVRLALGSTLEQTNQVVAKITELIRGLPGKPHVFSFAEEREPHAAMIFVKPAGKGGPAAAEVEKTLAGTSGARIRVGDVSPGEDAFPARIALMDLTEFQDPDGRGLERFRAAAERVLAAMAKDKDLVGPAAFPLSSATQRAINVNRDLCAKWGVELSDLLTALQTTLGGVHVTDSYAFGIKKRVSVLTDPQLAHFPENLATLTVRGTTGETVTLDKLLKIRESTEPTAVVSINGHRSIVITAAPAPGKSPKQVAAKCVNLAQEVLPKGYLAIDLIGP